MASWIWKFVFYHPYTKVKSGLCSSLHNLRGVKAQGMCWPRAWLPYSRYPGPYLIRSNPTTHIQSLHGPLSQVYSETGCTSSVGTGQRDPQVACLSGVCTEFRSGGWNVYVCIRPFIVQEKAGGRKRRERGHRPGSGSVCVATSQCKTL